MSRREIKNKISDSNNNTIPETTDRMKDSSKQLIIQIIILRIDSQRKRTER